MKSIYRAATGLLSLGVLACGSSSVTVVPPEDMPATVSIVRGDQQVGLEGVPLSDSLTVVVASPDSGPVAGATVEWSLSGPGSLGRPSSRTDENGIAQVLYTAGLGAATVRATVSQLSAAEFQVEGVHASPESTWTGRYGYVDYEVGTMPLVISAPHGGTIEAATIPDRTFGVTVRDFETDDLAARIADAIEDRTGHRPHLIISRLHRKKLDPNREIVEAAQGNPEAEQTWLEFQGFIEHARARVSEESDGFYMDVHGHGHAAQRLELGYLLNSTELGFTGELFDANGGTSSLSTLASRSVLTFEELIRGPESLGARFENAGVSAVPSPSQPDPGGEPYFNGGYNTWRWGSRTGGRIDGFQLEAHRGARDNAEVREVLAQATATVLLSFLEDFYGWTPQTP